MTQAHLPPDDGDLARLLGEAVRRHVEAPVDSERLVVGAQRGAARIRRRRRTGIAVLTAVVLVGVPAGLLRTGGSQPVETASSAGSATLDAAASGSAAASSSAAAASVAGIAPSPAPSDDLRPQGAAAGAAESGAPVPSRLPGTTTPRALASASPSAEAVIPLSPAAAAPLPVPDGALLLPGDLPQVTLTTTSDTANRQPAAATPGSVTCGQPLTTSSTSSTSATPLIAAGSRTVTYQRRPGPATSTWWQLSSTVRVFPAAGAAGYLGAAHRLACAIGAAGFGDDAITSAGRPDSAGRTQYYAVVRVGRTVSEVTLIVTRGGAANGTDLRRLLAVAAGRLNSSGLAATAAADPALGG
jgi:hypothetical protein